MPPVPPAAPAVPARHHAALPKVHWIALQCDRLDVDLLAQLAHQDGSNKSATVRRLIREEARRRGLLAYEAAPQQI